MKRVNLLTYTQLGESLYRAKFALSAQTNTTGGLWFSLDDLIEKLREFANDDSAFDTAKRSARELAKEIEDWAAVNVFAGPVRDYANVNFSTKHDSWTYQNLREKAESFSHVFDAESAEVDVYAVDQVSIYKSSELVSSASNRLPVEIRESLEPSVSAELDNAGKCLAFGLPTACGFHSLRALELVMRKYFRGCGQEKEFTNWGECVRVLDEIDKKRSKDKGEVFVLPSKRAIAMIDRVRDLDRNPLMHPNDTLDMLRADQIFNLCAISIIDLATELALLE